ncbi:MAG: pilus assembly protein [Thermoflexaceae bacterium]|nr:pilus assembly protein [Thermoflexaceae bacterium]
MKLRGSATIEAAVIIPLFTIIVVFIIGLAVDCHDTAVINCASGKLCMKAEFSGFSQGRYDTALLKELSGTGTAYIKEKVIKNSGVIQIEETLLNIETGYSSIEKNNPVEYVRLTDAAKKLIGKGGNENVSDKNHK